MIESQGESDYCSDVPLAISLIEDRSSFLALDNPAAWGSGRGCHIVEGGTPHSESLIPAIDQTAWAFGQGGHIVVGGATSLRLPTAIITRISTSVGDMQSL